MSVRLNSYIRSFRSLAKSYSSYSRILRHQNIRFNFVNRNAASTASTNDQPKEKPFQQSNGEFSSPEDKCSASVAAGETKDSMSELEKELTEKNKELLVKVAQLNDKYMRSLADNENIRQRMRREVADAKQFGIQNFVKDLLDVADVLNKAVEAVPKDVVDDSNPHFKNLFEGLKMTEAQLQTVLRRHGVTQVNPLGEKFNPNLHEALFEQEDSSKEPGTIGLVTKIGYKLHDRIIRPALVGVIKASSSS